MPTSPSPNFIDSVKTLAPAEVPDKPLGTFISLYSGAGGMDLGFALAGYKPIWSSELNKEAAETHERLFKSLEKYFPHLSGASGTMHHGDILEVPEDQLPQRGSADLVIGGPPCQGFSVAGKMDPEDPRSKHVFHFFDIVERINPRAFVLENVKALYSNARWSAIREALKERAIELGYETTLTLANSADYGVPQSRERMFLVGIKASENDAFDLASLRSHSRVSVREALKELPPYGTPGNDSLCTAKITLAKAPVLRLSPYAGMLFNGAGRPLDLDSPSKTLAASIGGNKTPIIDQALLEDPSNSNWVEQYHATLWKQPVDGPRISTIIPTTLRRLTVEEAAAIQTFPQGMCWAGSRSSRYRQIGNAVPPKLAAAVAVAVTKALRNA